MLTITDPARDRLSQKLARKTEEDGVALRLTRSEKGRWRLTPDREQPDDTAFSHDGKNVLLLDAAVSQAMTGMTLDVRDTQAGPRLKLRRNPSHGG